MDLRGTVDLDRAKAGGCRRRVVCAKVLDDVVLHQRVLRPSVPVFERAWSAVDTWGDRKFHRHLHRQVAVAVRGVVTLVADGAVGH